MDRRSAFETGTELKAARITTDPVLQEPEAEYFASLLLDRFEGDAALQLDNRA